MTTETQVVHLAPAQIAQASEMLARAFHDDPPSVWLFPDEAKRRRVLSWNFRLMSRYGHRYGEVHTTPGSPQAVAIWLPPDSPIASLPRLLRVGALPAPFITGFRAFIRFLSASRRMEQLHKRDVPPRHWYLMVLGVDPPGQGRGVGGALMQPVLARADREGLPCYLETAKEINVRFYSKHGFEVTVEDNIPGGPRYWTMTREPVR